MSSLFRHRASRRPPQRRGNTFLLIVGVLVALVAIGGIVWWTMFRDTSTVATGPILNEVSKGPYDYIVLEQGEVEPASAVELRCEVRSRGAGGSGGGITILEVKPEGTSVKKGDLLVKLDSSALEQERVQQQITVITSKALVTQATNTLGAAKIARREYEEGTFRQEENTILSEVFVAEQALSTAQLSFESDQRLAAKGILTPLQLAGSQFAVQKAQNDLANAKGKLDVLRKYTKEKMLKQFDSDIATAEAKVSAEENSFKLETDKLKDVEDQIAKCTITAPQDGQVVYVNKFSQGRSSSNAEFVVEAGAQVREQQPIVKLPNSTEVQVKALINEARVTLVRKGQPVTVRVDALKDQLIEGEVTKVNQYAEPAGWGGGNIKKYAAYVVIRNPPPELRSGMNAEVRIHIERRPEALQIPVQALAEHRGHYFVVLKKGEDQYETREVNIGSTNDKTAVIDKGLELKDQIVMNPRSFPRLQLPDLPEPVVVKEVKAEKGGVTPVPTVGQGGPQVTSPGAPGGGLNAGPPGTADGSKGRGGPGGPGGPGGGGRRGGGGFTPAAMVERTFQNDTDGDGKLSAAEIESIDERFRERVREADANKDGSVDKAEYLKAAEAMIKRMQESGFGGGGGGFGGGGAPGGGPPSGGGQ